MKARRVDLYPDDFLVGTMGLSDADLGVYFRICLLIYSSGGPITEELIKRVSPSHGRSLNASLRHLEQLSKITRNGAEIDQKRCRNELEKASIRNRKAAENAASRWNNNVLDDADGSGASNASRAHLPSPSPIKKDSESLRRDSDAGASTADPIKELWNRGKAVLGNSTGAASVLGKLRKEHGDAAVMEAIVATESALPSDPVSFIIGCLNRRRANGHGHKQSPAEKFLEGAFRGIEARQAHRRTDLEADDPLLDC